MVKKELDVFLSSDQKEFAKLRNMLAKKLCVTPFLACTPLENRGADPIDVVEASLRTVEKSDIYVGIFGRDFSETVIKEYQKAVECRLPCFTYVRVARRRDPQLSDFIDDVLKNQFHYYEFRHSADLEGQLELDLKRFILDTIILGLEERRKKKEEAKDLMTKEEKAQPQAVENKNSLREAETLLNRGDDLTALVTASIALETNLRKVIGNRDILVKQSSSLGELIRIAEKYQILDKQDLEALRKISYYRNLAVHMGDIPNKQAIVWILESSKGILNRLNMKREKVIISTEDTPKKTVNASNMEKAESVGSLYFLQSTDKVLKNSVYLLNENEPDNLNFDNTLLDEIYEKALKKALSAYSDCRLSSFSLQVYPYDKRETDDSIIKSSIIFNMSFYSANSGKSLRFHFSEEDGIYHTCPDEDAINEFERVVFSKTPWRGIYWKKFLSKALDKVKPLSVSEKTCYTLLVTPRLNYFPWTLHFFDGFNGKKYVFAWNGKGSDERSIQIELI
jgi:hypothetical protein